MPENIKDSLVFNQGHSDFDVESFATLVEPYYEDLKRVGRTKYLVAFEYGDGSDPEVTGYATNTTINATINSRVIKAQKTGGRWAIYRND